MSFCSDAKVSNSWVMHCEPLLTRLSAAMKISLSLTDQKGRVLFQTNDHCPCAVAETGRSCTEEYTRLSRTIVETGKPAVSRCSPGQELSGNPITYHREVLGILFACLESAKGEAKANIAGFLEEMARLIGTQMSDQMEMDSLAQEIAIRYEELNLIYDTGRELGRVEQLNTTIERIIAKTAETLDADLVMVSIWEKGIFALVSGNHRRPACPLKHESLRRQADEYILDLLASVDTSPPYVLFDGNNLPFELGRFWPVAPDVLAVPITLESQILGCLTVFKLSHRGSFSTGDVRLLAALGEQISILATNAALYDDLREFLLNVVKAFVASIEAKDAYTRGHSERVNQISMAIAENMGLTKEEKLVLNWASLLHDIGKIGIPEAILTKPGKLTAEEYSIIQEHPKKGTSILFSIDQLRDAIPGILHHHERLDGNGYPGGLKGTDIPLFARIIAVADTYDAMLSKRSYRDPIPREQTLAEISRVSGSQLDPEIVACLFESPEVVTPSLETPRPAGLEQDFKRGTVHAD